MRAKWTRVLSFALAGLCAVLAVTAADMIGEEARLSQQARQDTQSLLKAAQIAPPTLTEPPEQAQDEQATPAQDEQAPPEGGQRRAVLQDVKGYPIIAKLSISKLSLELPVIGETTDKALKIAPCLYCGPSTPADAGNMVISGHNNKDGSQFGRLNRLKAGDTVALMDKWGDTYNYEVYDIATIEPDNVAILEEYEGERALSLLTCTSNGNRRLLMRCRMIEN